MRKYICTIFLLFSLIIIAGFSFGQTIKSKNTYSEEVLIPVDKNNPYVDYGNVPDGSFELINKRSAHSRTFLNHDGSYSLQQSIGYLNYLDDNNVLQPLQNKVTSNSQDPNILGIFQSDLPLNIDIKSGKTEIFLAKNQLLKYGDSAQISFVDVDGRKIKTEIKSDIIDNSEINGNQIVLNNYFYGIDKYLQVENYQIKNDYVLKNPLITTSDKVKYLVITEEFFLPNGCDLLKGEGKMEGNLWFGNLKIIDNELNQIGYISCPIFYDSNPIKDKDTYIIGSFTWEKTHGNKFEISLWVPISWLNDPSRIYPVIIDPTVSASHSNYLSVYQNNGFSSSCQYTLSPNVPASTVTNSSTTYKITAQNGGYKSEQRSRVGYGANWSATQNGIGNSTGTQTYSIATMTIANGAWAGGNMNFVWQSYQTYYSGTGCVQTYQYGADWSITVTYEVCSAPSSVSIAGGSTSVCYGTSPGTLTATPTGGTPASYTYLWYNNSSSTGITTSTCNPGNITADASIYCAVSTGSGCVKNSPTQTITVNPLFVNQWISLNTNGASFCPGETRSITVRVKNLGCSSWTSSSGTNVNFSYWWNTQGQDSNPRILPFSGLAQGAEQDVTFNVTAPATPGTYTLNFDLVREAVCWFRNNSGPGGCGPGNVLYTSPSLTVGSPLITTQPVNTAVCENGSGSFTTATSAGAPTYQWFYGGSPSGPWTITDVVPGLSGHSTSTLLLTNIPLGYSGAYVKCDVTSGGCTTASNAALLTVTSNVPASVTISPNPVGSVCYGTSVTFTASPVNGGPAPSYQWKVNGVNTGTNSSTFSTAGLNNGYIVTCVMTSSICASGSPAASNAVTMTINPIPAITAQPANLTLCEGSNGNFVVATSSGSPTFQWYYGGSPSGPWTITDAVPGLSGHTTSTLSLTGAPLGYTGAYVKCDITSAGCTVASNSALLTVNGLPAITSHPTSVSKCTGESASFSVTAIGTGLTYQWRKGGVNISGATSSTYTIASIVAGDAGSYDCVVSGTCLPAVISNTAVLTVTSGPAITSQPQNCTQNVGYIALFSVSATGATSFQWQVSTDNGASYNSITSSGYSPYVTYANWTTSTLTVTINNVLANGYRLRCVLSNGSPACNVTSSGAILSIGCTGNTYSWSGYSAGQTFTGNSYTYIQNVMSAKVTYNSAPAWNYGTPKYSKPDPGWGCNPDYAPTGLLIDVDWSSNTHYVTVDISFSVPACGPVSFYIYDINDDGFDAWRDCIEINATNYLNAPVTPTAVNCSGGVIQSTSGSTLTIKSAYLGNSCTCYGFTNAPNKITIGNSLDKIKTITIKYFSAIASKGDPARQYIDISDITTGTPPEVPLPIELFEFNGKCANGKIKLEWSTTSETNNDYFTILRSADANKWEDIATVQGSGNSNNTLYYSATDDHPLGNTSYYKLRQTDFDGKSETFAPITITCGNGEGTPQINYYPNPFTSDLVVDIENLKTDKAFLTIYDVYGKKVFDKFINKNELLETNFTINLGNLPAGIYLASFTSDVYSNTSRLVKSY